jgi:hypothetical protein
VRWTLFPSFISQAHSIFTVVCSPVAVNYPFEAQDEDYYEDEEEGDFDEPLPPSAFKLKVC